VSEPITAPADIYSRLASLEWDDVARRLSAFGAASLHQILTDQECDLLVDLYQQKAQFRSHIVLQRHGFGQGEYQYFNYPLPEIIGKLRTALYPRLAIIANRWNEQMKIDIRYPETHRAYLDRCHAAGQVKPTPLLLQYAQGDYNCLHQDVYGELIFPLQIVFLLSAPGKDFTGGEFVMTEQRPRMQTRAQVFNLQQGEAVIFAVRHRPVQGAKGIYRVNMRHGVSKVHSGRRHTLGIIFHDAQ
jgi:hypothetical protein